MSMKSWKRRGWKERLYELLTSIAVTTILVFLMSATDKNNPVLLAIFSVGTFIILILSFEISQRGKSKIIKEVFNIIWNFETTLAFIYALYVFMLHVKETRTIAQIIDATLALHPWLIYAGIATLAITVVFRFGLSLADLLTTPKKTKPTFPNLPSSGTQ